MFSYAIPFVSFVLDHGVKRVENSRRTEKSIWVFTKLAMIIYYLGVYVMSLEIKTSNIKEPVLDKFYILSTINLFMFPLLNCAYSYALKKGKLY